MGVFTAEDDTTLNKYDFPRDKAPVPADSGRPSSSEADDLASLAQIVTTEARRSLKRGSHRRAATMSTPDTHSPRQDQGLDARARRIETLSRSHDHAALPSLVRRPYSSLRRRKVFERVRSTPRNAAGEGLGGRRLYSAFQTLAASDQPCALSSTGAGVSCIPVSSACPTPTALDNSAIWAMTRVPLAAVPSSSVWLSESMTNLNYDLDYARVDTFPYVIGQMALRNFAPFEQFLTAKAAKRLFSSFTFTWFVEIRPEFYVAVSQLPAIITQPVQGIVTALIAPIVTILDAIIPGLGAFVPGSSLPVLTISQLGVEIPIGFQGSHVHTEDFEVVASYSITAPPQTHIMGRTIAHVGRSSVPFTMDVSRSVHVPAGVYGQATGQVITYDYKVPGIYEGANLVNTEFLVDAL